MNSSPPLYDGVRRDGYPRRYRDFEAVWAQFEINLMHCDDACAPPDVCVVFKDECFPRTLPAVNGLCRELYGETLRGLPRTWLHSNFYCVDKNGTTVFVDGGPQGTASMPPPRLRAVE